MKTSETVLISGGSGLIGRRLGELLMAEGYHVRILTRKKKPSIALEQAEWNPETNFLEKDALLGIDFIINLSGTGIADKRWTEKRKKEIIDSRVKPVKTLIHHLKNSTHQVKAFINASAIGIYPKNTSQVMTEESLPGDDFLSLSVVQWENALMQAELPVNIRKIILRFGAVLSLKGGALPQILMPLRFRIAACLGSGKQTVSWVHLDDVCYALVHLLRHQQLSGVYNVTAPLPVTFKALTDEIRRAKNQWSIKVSVPAFILKLMLGERACLVLDSVRVSSALLKSTGFSFRFPAIAPALKDLLNGNKQ